VVTRVLEAKELDAALDRSTPSSRSARPTNVVLGLREMSALRNTG